jgi:hypothetical protein
MRHLKQRYHALCTCLGFFLCWAVAASDAVEAQTLKELEDSIRSGNEFITTKEPERQRWQQDAEKAAQLVQQAERDRVRLEGLRSAGRTGLDNQILRATNAENSARIALHTAATELVRVEREIQVAKEAIEEWDKRRAFELRRVQNHMDCVARSRSILRFMEYTTQSSPDALIGHGAAAVAEDLRTEFARVYERGIEGDRQSALMNHLLPTRARQYFSRIRATVEQEGPARWGANAAPQQRVDALAKLQTTEQRFGQALAHIHEASAASTDCSRLVEMLADAETVFWHSRGGLILGRSETLTGRPFNLTPGHTPP